MNDLKFLIWLHHRLTEVHKDDTNVDFMHKFRSILDDYPVDKVTPNTFSGTITDLEVKLVKYEHEHEVELLKKKLQKYSQALRKIAAEDVIFPETNYEGYGSMAVVTARDALKEL